jgi:hypothetical protein
MRRGQPFTRAVEHETRERTWNTGAALAPMLDPVVGQVRLNSIPQVLFNDWLMEARMPRAFVHDDANVNRVLEH